jgi:hypothetical protein
MAKVRVGVDAGTQDAYMAKVRVGVDAVLASTFTSTVPAKVEITTEDVKALFASMGTPFDSKCPHGLPFYACMPCSH